MRNTQLMKTCMPTQNRIRKPIAIILKYIRAERASVLIGLRYNTQVTSRPALSDDSCYVCTAQLLTQFARIDNVAVSESIQHSADNVHLISSHTRTWLVSSAMDTSLVSLGGSQRNMYSLYMRQEAGWAKADRHRMTS